MQKNKGCCNSLLAIDAIQTLIEKIKKNKIAFLGKKKHHALITQIIIDIYTNQIISTDFCYGSVHDYKLFLKSNTFINPNKEILADSWSQGLKNIHEKTLIPFKKAKITH